MGKNMVCPTWCILLLMGLMPRMSCHDNPSSESVGQPDASMRRRRRGCRGRHDLLHRHRAAAPARRGAPAFGSARPGRCLRAAAGPKVSGRLAKFLCKKRESREISLCADDSACADTDRQSYRPHPSRSREQWGPAAEQPQ